MGVTTFATPTGVTTAATLGAVALLWLCRARRLRARGGRAAGGLERGGRGAECELAPGAEGSSVGLCVAE